MIKTIAALIAFSTMVNFLLAAGFLFKRYLADKHNLVIFYLFLFTLAKSLSMVDFTAQVYFFKNAVLTNPLFFICLDPFGFLYGPCFYFYIQACCNKSFHFTWRQLIHLLPALLTIVFILHNLQIGDLTGITSKRDFYNFYGVAEQKWLFPAKKWLVIYYLVLCLLTLRQYFIEIGKGLSEPKQNRQWLVTLVFSMLAINFWLIVSPILQEHFNLPWSFRHYSYAVATIMLFILVTVVVFRSITIHQSEVALPILIAPPKHTKQPKVSPSQLKQVITDLHTCMTKHQPYLELGLTLDELAAKTGWPPRLISEAIKISTGENFYRFINRHRIEVAKSLLSKQPEKSVTEIMYDSGFAGKSTFHDAFKSFVQMTPSQYRQSAIITVGKSTTS